MACLALSGAVALGHPLDPVAPHKRHTHHPRRHHHHHRRRRRHRSNAGHHAVAVRLKGRTVVSVLPPIVSGTPIVGQVLSTTTGSWQGNPTSYAYGWMDCSVSGAACAVIAGASRSTYTLAVGDAGHTIRSTVTASNRQGSSASAVSTQTASVTGLPPHNTAAPTISGVAQQGDTLVASTGTWQYSPTGYSYEWDDCSSAGCSAITGASTSSGSYTLQASDVNSKIRVLVTARNAFGASSPANSDQTATVLPAVPVNSGAPTISGVPQQGSTLTADPGTWSPTPTSYSYSWKDCLSGTCTAIAGAGSASTYVLQASDVGDTIEVAVTATNTGGSSAPVISAPTATVTGAGSSGSCSGAQLCVSLPAGSTPYDLSIGTEDNNDGLPTQSPPGGGHPNIYQRMSSADFGAYRNLGQTSWFVGANTQISPVNYYWNIGSVSSPNVFYKQAWSFLALDKQLSEVPTSVAREVTQIPPYSMFDCAPGDGSWTNSSTGCYTGGNPPGGLAYSNSRQAAFYAAIVAYFRTGLLASGSGTTSYTASTLTDTTRSFSGDVGDCITATVTDSFGLPDWVQGTVASIGGAGSDTVTLTANWSAANSYDVVAGNSGSITSTTPAAGAAYNLASCTPPSGTAGGVSYSLTTPQNATPWPLPPSVGDVRYFGIDNEPDLSNTNLAFITPSLPAPSAITLTGVSRSGGTLTPGATYTYEVTSLGDAGGESLPSSTHSITLPSGDNAVQISWSGTSNANASPSAYAIYGRTSGPLAGLAGVGAASAAGLIWTDTGTPTPSGSPPSSDTSNWQYQVTPYTLVQEWNTVVPVLKAIDPSIKATGPTQSNTKPIGGDPWIDPTCVTTSGLGSACANGDPGLRNYSTYVNYLIANANPKPDVITFHAYGGGDDTNESYSMSSVESSQIGNWNSYGEHSAIDAAGLPVWIDEGNVSANNEGNESYGTDFRSMTQMGAAWWAESVVDWANQDPNVKYILDWADQGGDTAWSLFESGTPSASCLPAPACSNLANSEPDLAYWAVDEINNMLPGGRLVPVSNVPAGFAALAVQTDATHVVVLLVNTAVGIANGQGSPGTVGVQVAGATVSDTQATVINGSTSPANGPVTTDLGAQSSVTVNAAGYEVDLLRFTI
jgi:hypothetical protein